MPCAATQRGHHCPRSRPGPGHDLLSGHPDPTPALDLLKGRGRTPSSPSRNSGSAVSAPFPGELEGEVVVVPWEELAARPVTPDLFAALRRRPTTSSTSPDHRAARLQLRRWLHRVARHQPPRACPKALSAGAGPAAAAGRAGRHRRRRGPAQRSRDAPVGRARCRHGQRAPDEVKEPSRMG